MDWFALDTKRQLSFERKRVPFEVRGFHLAVLALLAERECGAELPGAANWTTRDWSLACGGTRKLAEKLVSFGLARWNAGNLFVHDYDVDGEQRVKKARESGAKGGKSRGSASSDPSTAAASDPASEPRPTAPTRDGTRRNGNETEEKRRVPARAAPEVSPDACEVAAYLLEAIRSHKPDMPDSSGKWVKAIDLAIRVDKRSPDRLKAVIDFAHRSRVVFWRPNVLSGEKLREKFDQLEIQAAGVTPIRDVRVGHVAVTGNEKYAGREVKL